MLAQAEAGRGQVVGVVGEPGLGKSRLLSEFRRGLRQRRLTYLATGCPSYAQAIPFVAKVGSTGVLCENLSW